MNGPLAALAARLLAALLPRRQPQPQRVVTIRDNGIVADGPVNQTGSGNAGRDLKIN
ncbi:MAG: hypothetical protein ACKVWR_03505 [Acidimicrobiales bacterium]